MLAFDMRYIYSIIINIDVNVNVISVDYKTRDA